MFTSLGCFEDQAHNEGENLAAPVSPVAMATVATHLSLGSLMVSPREGDSTALIVYPGLRTSPFEPLLPRGL